MEDHARCHLLAPQISADVIFHDLNLLGEVEVSGEFPPILEGLLAALPQTMRVWHPMTTSALTSRLMVKSILGLCPPGDGLARPPGIWSWRSTSALWWRCAPWPVVTCHGLRLPIRSLSS